MVLLSHSLLVQQQPLPQTLQFSQHNLGYQLVPMCCPLHRKVKKCGFKTSGLYIALFDLTFIVSGPFDEVFGPPLLHSPAHDFFNIPLLVFPIF